VSDVTPYKNRLSAGEQLAEAVATALGGVEAAVRVVALPRGGIPVAVPLAQRLNCPLEVLAAKKIALPSNPELALGAVTPDGTTVWGQTSLLEESNQQALTQAREKALQSAIAQQEKFNPHCPSASIENSIVIIVDDGIATGMTMLSAVKALRDKKPAQVWMAAPVAPLEMKPQLEQSCDRAIILQTPDPFWNVGRFYKEFPQVSTEEAIAQLKEQAKRAKSHPQP